MFLYTHNGLSEKEIKKKIQIIAASKRIKYLGINQTKEIKILYSGEESRWRRNRTGRSLSLLQIHRKNNRTVNKVYKTTSDR